MTSIRLTRKQITQLAEIAEKFNEIDSFELQVTYESGIGATIRVKFDLIGETSATTDITDVSNW